MTPRLTSRERYGLLLLAAVCLAVVGMTAAVRSCSCTQVQPQIVVTVEPEEELQPERKKPEKTPEAKPHRPPPPTRDHLLEDVTD